MAPLFETLTWEVERLIDTIDDVAVEAVHELSERHFTFAKHPHSHVSPQALTREPPVVQDLWFSETWEAV